MRVAPDETYRAQPNWEGALRSTVARISDIYEKNFQIRFVILDIVPWTAGAPGSPQRLIGQMMSAVLVGEADVLVGFSNRCERLRYGVAKAFHRIALVTTGCYEALIVKDFAPEPVVLSHELAHLFGAFHPMITVDSVMRGGAADKFDDQTARTIRLMRNFDFRRGVMGVDQETRRAWTAIYAEGHAGDEPSPLAGALADVGFTLFQSGKLDEGETALREAARIDPSFATPHTGLGFLFSHRNQFEDALRELQAAKALDFHQVEARAELGRVLLRLGRDEDALLEFREVLRVDPRFAPARAALGMMLVRRGRLDEAISEYDEAIRLEPKDSVAWSDRGSTYRRKGLYDRAIQDYDQAILLGPTEPRHWNNRCFTRAIAGKLQEALADCNESLRLRPDSAVALDSRALAYLKLDQPGRATTTRHSDSAPGTPMLSMGATWRSARRATSRVPRPTSRPRLRPLRALLRSTRPTECGLDPFCAKGRPSGLDGP